MMAHKFSNENWDDVSQIKTTSTTPLEADVGYGHAAIIRCFEFAANPEVFKQHKPTKQELFNYHSKAIEIQLWGDGFNVMPDVSPKIVISKNKKKYRIFVGARPKEGMSVLERPKTLSQIAHNK